MLTLTDITLTYPDGDSRLTAIDHASLEVGRGEFVAVTGPSGSGKSSLLSVASTLVRPDSGRVDIDGVNASALSRAEASLLRRDRLGIVFQAPNLIPSLTVTDQLEIIARMGAGAFARSPKRQRAAHIREVLDSVGLGEAAGRRPGQLSGGQRQRVNIARAIVHEPSVLLVDEPTAALDSDRSASIIDLLARMTREHNLATVVVTHDLDILEAFDGAYEMVDGVLSAPAHRRSVAA